MISDGSAAFSSDALYPTANNQIAMRGSGGFRLYTSPNKSTGVSLAANGTSWETISDRNKKENFRPVSGAQILAGVIGLPITNWNYIGADPNRRYIGPTAKDFQATFGLGEDTSITPQDMDGVTLAAVQELGKRAEQAEKENTALEERVEKLEEEGARDEDLAEENASLREELDATGKRQDELEERLKKLEAGLKE